MYKKAVNELRLCRKATSEDGRKTFVETKVEALKDNQVKLTVTVEAKEIDDRIKKTYKDFAHKYNFPGFRQGKAPRPIIDNALGAEAVRATVTDAVLNELYPLAADENNLYPVSQPQFEDQEALVEAGKPFTFTATISVKPELELSSYSPVEIELPSENATDEEIEAQIDQLREHYYAFEDDAASAKIAEDGYADLTMKVTDDAGEEIESLTTESRLYGLGVGLFPATFDTELIGLKKGQKKSFDIDITSDSSIMTSSLAGKTEKIHFDIEVLVVKKKNLPEVTDEWAKDTLGFEDVADLRKRIAESIEQQKQEMLPGMRENACLNVIAERLEGDVPQSMTDANEADLLQSFFQQLQTQSMSFDMYLMQQGLTADQFKDDVKQQATDITKQDLALDAWARHAKMEVTGKDLTEEFVKSGAEDPEALEAEWRANGQMHMLRQGILRTRAVKEIMDGAVVTELTGAKAEKKSDAKKAPAKKAAAKKSSAKKDEGDKAEGEAPAKKASAKKAAPKKTEE